MMSRLGVVVAGVVLLIVCHPTTVSCQPRWGVTAYAGVSPWVNTGLLDLDDASQATTPVVGVALERALTSAFAIEGDLQLLPRFLKRGGPDSLLTSSRLVVASASLVRRLRAGRQLMPRAAIGIAAVRFSARDRLSALDHDATLLGVTASGGATLRITRTLAARCDVRYLRTQRDASLGVFDDAYVDLFQATLGIHIGW